MRLWIDLANSPHVPFFKALVPKLTRQGHEVVFTARDFAETIPLATAAGLVFKVIGKHGGRQVSTKGTSLVARAWSLFRWARVNQIDRAISHNSYSQILAARLLGIKTVTLMDYEYQPANHLAFRFSSVVVVPDCFPSQQLRRFGAGEKRVRRFHGMKEDVYLAEFKPDPGFARLLTKLEIDTQKVLVVMRPPALDALYHRFENRLFDETLATLQTRKNTQVILLPRNKAQRDTYASGVFKNLVVLKEPLDGANLLAASDLVVSAGGTMNREAAVLGVPVASVYAGRWSAIDQRLVDQGRLKRIQTISDITALPVGKKYAGRSHATTTVIGEVATFLLE
ncbi:MAG: DUF354 domain-containing protein [Pyrinomonadaceae bacterium]